ncbi:NYN domain-containing protein [Helicobacter mustelae]|uniref:NYN domain-containing protein n=1 Tax=Helicobacter mustelae (strain ATCC 43772 / CCUG 25715 / CIP 103759 / LMG 18044 / NCTC 12198 / R85-136P) TaxID=679897 RepID=D3UHH2_HELM1|nr:NYN domain-containing protein [Helicobacter mustelae]CBG39944.1 Putative hypothetical protein [Helicobacter mustelae 12198]SQH71455.1 NYN domain [Helicobacter mustelae]STP12583.1 NYN domain [Helicobacter mustelae]
MDKERKIALFLDCENVAAKWAREIFERLESIGDVCIKKAYGDWRNDALNPWNAELIQYAIEPIHIITGNHYKNNQGSGKNSCDIKISIDIMNCLYDKIVDCIVIVSSDSDFAPLAQEIRSKGLQVIGFGENKARDDYRKSFTSFEILQKQEEGEEKIKNNRALVRMLKKAINETANQNGVALVSQVGSWIRYNYSQTAKSYGKNSWGDVFKSLKEDFSITYDGNVMKVEYSCW